MIHSKVSKRLYFISTREKASQAPLNHFDSRKDPIQSALLSCSKMESELLNISHRKYLGCLP